jgi:hypothetical protein
MAYDLAPLRSYVRFYQTVVTQITGAWAALQRTHETARKELLPFADPLASVCNATLAACLAESPAPPPALRALWRPQDPEELMGLTDVYEVVGRFTFQGEDNENLGRVQTIVSCARNEMHAQRTRLADLQKLPGVARAAADRLAADEAKNQAARRSAKLAAFAPLAATLHQRAKQSVDAVRGVEVPSLADVQVAADEYRGYVKKLDQVYQTCLPFLRKALADMYEFTGSEVPSSWPDTLPVQPDLPAELLMVPPTDSPELKRARSAMQALDQEENELARARDDVLVTTARLEGELNAFHAKDSEAQQEIVRAGTLVAFATKLEQLDETHRNLANLEQQKAHRTQNIGDLTQRQKQSESTIEALSQELATRKHEIGEAAQQLALERDNEPALFGKDDWRNRVAELEQHIDNLRNGYAQREGLLNQLKIDLSSLTVQVQTEQSQSALIDRWLGDAKARDKSLEAETRELDQRLGPDRPLQRPSVAQAEQFLAGCQNARSELLDRSERMKAEVRRNKEEHARVLARIKQIEVERQKMGGFVQSAQVAATQGFEEAMRQLAARRRSAVGQHVNEVIGELEKSLVSVDAVFVEPARDAMLGHDVPVESLAARVQEHADKLKPVVDALVNELEPDLLSQDAMLGQVQREFCDVAVEACRNAWGA